MNIQIEKNKDKRCRIMLATIELVAECGIHATPMSQISKHADVAAGTIYNYFENKEALMRETYLEVRQRQFDYLHTQTDPSLDYQAQFVKYWHAMYETLLIPHYLSFLDQSAISPLIDESTIQQVENVAQPIVEFFDTGVQTGLIKQLPNRLLFHLIFGSVASVARIHLTSRLELDNATLEQACLFCWDGLKS